MDTDVELDEFTSYKNRMYRMPVDDLLAKDDGPDNGGYLEGNLAVFGNVDRGGERIIRGAFQKSIDERVRAGRVPLMSKHLAHGGGVEDVIGVITEARETDSALWIRAVFAKDYRSQAVRKKVADKMVHGLSVGYRLIKWDDEYNPGTGRKILNLRECQLVEGTVTVNPMNEQAVILAAKSLRDDLADPNVQHPVSQDRVDALIAAIAQLTGEPLGKAESLALPTRAVEEWSEVTLESLRKQQLELNRYKLEEARKSLL